MSLEVSLGIMNPEHLAILKSGVKIWNEWRKQHSEIQPDLSQANLGGLDLRNINLKGAELSQSEFTQSNLQKANLSRANLTYALLFEVNLENANLTGSRLLGADFAFSKLNGANLSRSVLHHANLTGCNLSRGILRRAELMHTIVCSASLVATDLTGARLLETIFVDTDLRKAKGLDTCKHLGPSTVDHRTLLKSGIIPQIFFKACGMPNEMLEALTKAKAKMVYHSTFIGYGEPDRGFAERLHRKLTAQGISCWVYSLDSTVGKVTWREITEKRRSADKMIITCSVKALARHGVLKEIEDQIDDDPNKIIPISLDDRWKEEDFRVVRGTRDLKSFLIERNYADFRNLSYTKAIRQLLKALERPK